MSRNDTPNFDDVLSWADDYGRELDALLEQLSSEPLVQVEPWSEAELDSLLALLELDETVCPFCGRPYEAAKGDALGPQRTQKDRLGAKGAKQPASNPQAGGTV
jgi:hypothetical protein